MDNGYLGTIEMVGFNFAPKNYSLCAGQIMSIAQFNALFALLGTNFGGDGRSTFGLPDMRGRVPMGQGQGPGLTDRVIGQKIGSSEYTTLSLAQLPSHTHTAALSNVSASVSVNANSGNGNQSTATGNYWASLSDGGRGSQNTYADTGNSVMAADAVEIGNVTGAVTVGNTGNGSPISILQPSTVVNFIICVQGLFPSRN